MMLYMIFKTNVGFNIYASLFSFIINYLCFWISQYYGMWSLYIELNFV